MIRTLKIVRQKPMDKYTNTCCCVLFFIIIFIRVTTNNHMTKSILGCLIFSANGINLKTLHFSLRQTFLDKGKKQPPSVPSITRKISRPHTNILHLLSLFIQEPTVQITPSTTVFHAPTRMAQ